MAIKLTIQGTSNRGGGGCWGVSPFSRTRNCCRARDQGGGWIFRGPQIRKGGDLEKGHYGERKVGSKKAEVEGFQ